MRKYLSMPKRKYTYAYEKVPMPMKKYLWKGTYVYEKEPMPKRKNTFAYDKVPMPMIRCLCL